MSLIKATKEVDAGPIYFQKTFMLDGTELYDEFRNIQGIQVLNILKKFLKKYPKAKQKNKQEKVILKLISDFRVL